MRIRLVSKCCEHSVILLVIVLPVRAVACVKRRPLRFEAEPARAESKHGGMLGEDLRYLCRYLVAWEGISWDYYTWEP